ncbi:vascular endothelial growth factor A [Phyllostomus discolor]|uniref:Vascular endothelial growth factor A n=2 Tax=Phyllostomus discolor TaxID=89673 RepID=A0A834AWT6_9CHIR|nr:vascular endothelial growth factor A [Phyllostomus discolor]
MAQAKLFRFPVRHGTCGLEAWATSVPSHDQESCHGFLISHLLQCRLGLKKDFFRSLVFLTFFLVMLYLSPFGVEKNSVPIAWIGEVETSVVKFMDVYQRSYCRPIETLVDIFQEYPDEIEYIFKPSCVPLMRCGGCCNDEALECVPTEEFNITMQIMRIRIHKVQHIGEMSFLQHSKCECRPKKDRARQENPCGPCSERRKHLFVQDPQTCKCSCKNTDSRCKARQLELNERTCRCDKPRR